MLPLCTLLAANDSTSLGSFARMVGLGPEGHSDTHLTLDCVEADHLHVGRQGRRTAGYDAGLQAGIQDHGTISPDTEPLLSPASNRSPLSVKHVSKTSRCPRAKPVAAPLHTGAETGSLNLAC